MAWLAGFALVFLALLSLQFDRTWQAPSQIASVIESTGLDPLDGGDDETSAFDSDDTLLAAAPLPTPILHGVALAFLSLDAQSIIPASLLGLSARGPPARN
ncbi:hypothetical protein [Methylocella sp. CPCC 101449]|jgi:hypothetical protein|uniref:hypothetical protein n=1 Tax=Methylocella sp. CPCC 101449 TaxID=2987531 RepID=UPI00288CD495|nr:hypothetical protein [Methylocella sp. CPCC 101449]MDT2023377.1 hypothetical protein [Methylocella sp. CPCC 101449]HEV2574089.1 hypothetical protein [Beijerinckiaceae bacterium]